MSNGPWIRNKREKKISIGVKFKVSRLKLLIDNFIIPSGCRIIGDEEPLYNSANDYIDKLITTDLIKRRIINEG